MREHAAKALAEYFEYPDDWELYLEQVDVVLNAIKKPTGDMLWEGAEKHLQYFDQATEPEHRGKQPTECELAQIHFAYDAMIQAALDGK